jgi:FecR protein
MRTTTIGLALIAMMSSTSAWAGSVPWTVSESSGTVNVLHAGTSKIVQRGGALAIGDVVLTGAKGRAVLVRGKEYLVVSPNSRISIADPAQSGGFIQIVQNWGSAVFKIEKKTEKHFAVKTPYLAAVVKGTTFNVTVDEKGARVQVTEGRVEVATPDGKAVSMVMPGEVGLVAAGDRLRLRVQGIESRVIDSPQRGSEPVEARKDDVVAELADEQQVAQAEETPVANAETQDSSASASVKISQPIGEGEVKLETVTSGLVRGDSSLVASVKPVQVAFAATVSNPQAPPSPVSAGQAAEETIETEEPPERITPPTEDPALDPKPPEDAVDMVVGDIDNADITATSPTGSNSGSGSTSESSGSGSSGSTSGSSGSGSGNYTYKVGGTNVTIASATNSSGSKNLTVTSTGQNGQTKSTTFTLPTRKP